MKINKKHHKSSKIARFTAILMLLFCISNFTAQSQSTQSSPVNVVKKYYELQEAMTPDNFTGTQEELEALQSDLIDQSLVFLCDNGLPLTTDSTKFIKNVENPKYKMLEPILTSVYIRITKQLKVKRNDFTIITPLWRRVEFITFTQKWYEYDTLIKAHYDFPTFCKKAKVILWNNNIRLKNAYIKYTKLSLANNAEVGGVNIIDYSILGDGQRAIVEAYTNNSDNEYILLRKIEDKWYIDHSDNGYSTVFPESQLELKQAIEEYKNIIAKRPAKPNINTPESETLPAPEDFDKFIIRFYKDTQFQIERVKFPIGMVYDMWTDTKAPFTSETWKHIKGYGVSKKSETEYGGKWVTDGGASGGSILFELNKDNKWYLTKYETF